MILLSMKEANIWVSRNLERKGRYGSGWSDRKEAWWDQKETQSLTGKSEAGISALTSKGNTPKGSSRLIFL